MNEDDTRTEHIAPAPNGGGLERGGGADGRCGLGRRSPLEKCQHRRW